MSDLNLANISWRLDAYAGHWLTNEELTAITDWMADNQLHRATAERPVVVEPSAPEWRTARSPTARIDLPTLSALRTATS